MDALLSCMCERETFMEVTLIVSITTVNPLLTDVAQTFKGTKVGTMPEGSTAIPGEFVVCGQSFGNISGNLLASSLCNSLSGTFADDIAEAERGMLKSLQ